MKKIAALVALTLATVTAHANPTISALYENNKFIENEGVNVELAHVYKNFQIGVNGTVDNDKLQTYGATLGVPLNVHNTKLTVTPSLGVDRYRDINETVGTVGVGVKYPVFKTVYLDARAKLAFPLSSSNDLDNDGVYQIGLTKQF